MTPPTHSRLSGLDLGSRYPEILPLQLTSRLWKWLGSATVSTHVATPLLEQGLVLAWLGRSSRRAVHCLGAGHTSFLMSGAADQVPALC